MVGRVRTGGLRTAAGLLAALLCSLTLASCGGPDADEPAPTTSPAGPTRVVRYLPLGDSITDGYTVPGGFRTRLWERLVATDHDQIDFVGSLSSGPAALGDRDNEGHSGWCIDGACGGDSAKRIYPHVHEWMSTYRPDVVTIHLGTNDLRLGDTGRVVALRLDRTIAQVYRDNPEATVLVATIVDMKGFDGPRGDYNALIPDIVARYAARGRRIELVDQADALHRPGDFADALHPNTQGYATMADVWYPALTRAYRTSP